MKCKLLTIPILLFFLLVLIRTGYAVEDWVVDEDGINSDFDAWEGSGLIYYNETDHIYLFAKNGTVGKIYRKLPSEYTWTLYNDSVDSNTYFSNRLLIPDGFSQRAVMFGQYPRKLMYMNASGIFTGIANTNINMTSTSLGMTRLDTHDAMLVGAGGAGSLQDWTRITDFTAEAQGGGGTHWYVGGIQYDYGAGGGLAYGVETNGVVYTFTSGSLRSYHSNLKYNTSAMEFWNGTVFAGTHTGDLYGLNTTKGKFVKNADICNNKIIYDLEIFNGSLYVGCADGQIYRYDDDGTVTLSYDDSGLGDVYALGAYNNDTLWASGTETAIKAVCLGDCPTAPTVGKANFTVAAVGDTVYRPGQTAVITVKVEDSSGVPVSNADCNVSIYNQDFTKSVTGAYMSYVPTSLGLYNYTFAAQGTEGIYTYEINCTAEGASDYDIHTYQVTDLCQQANITQIMDNVDEIPKGGEKMVILFGILALTFFMAAGIFHIVDRDEEDSVNILPKYLFQFAGILMGLFGLRTASEIALVDYTQVVADNIITGVIIFRWVLYIYIVYLLLKLLIYSVEAFKQE